MRSIMLKQLPVSMNGIARINGSTFPLQVWSPFPFDLIEFVKQLIIVMNEFSFAVKNTGSPFAKKQHDIILASNCKIFIEQRRVFFCQIEVAS